MTLTIEEILKCTGGELIKKGKDTHVSKISIDTRNIKDEEIFLGVKGENFNGNKYILDAISKGVKLCIVSENHLTGDHDVSLILVDDTIKALENIARFVRGKLDKVKLIGVTGSVGKTSTKDIVHSILSSQFKAYKTLGNFNNHLGMPISLINIDDDAEVGVFELGMNALGEIDHLASILRPHIGIITNIGVSHIEFLGSRENILKAKMEIDNYVDTLIVNGEDDLLREVTHKDLRKVGFASDSHMRAYDVKSSLEGSEFSVIYNGENEKIELPLLGEHNILNTLIALEIGEILKEDIANIKKGVKNVTLSNMRQEVINYKNMIIINDCYNASPTSMKSSIDVLSLYNKKKLCILGDMGELGCDSPKYHEEIGRYAMDKVDKLLAIGKYKDSYVKGFLKEHYTFHTLEDFYENITKVINGDEAILIKASRSSKFENILSHIKNTF